MSDADQLLPVEGAISDAVAFERANTLCREAYYAVCLQCRRLLGEEPEDREFLFRRWADLLFLIIALDRLAKSARLARRGVAFSHMEKAISDFGNAIPDLRKLRNVASHIDEYVEGNARSHKEVSRGELELGSWHGPDFKWLGGSLNLETAQSASYTLWQSVKAAGVSHNTM